MLRTESRRARFVYSKREFQRTAKGAASPVVLWGARDYDIQFGGYAWRTMVEVAREGWGRFRVVQRRGGW